MNPENAQSKVDKHILEDAISTSKGSLTKDETVEVLLEYIRTLQRTARHSLIAGVETDYGSMQVIGGNFDIMYIIMRALWKDLRKRAGFWSVLFAPLTTWHYSVTNKRDL